MEYEVRREPWLTKDAVQLLQQFVNEQSKVLEFGAGGSTVWLSERAATLVTIEHNPEWVEKVKSAIGRDIDIRLYESAVIQGTDHLVEPYDHVCDDFENDSFDFVLVDGRDRVQCVKQAMRLLRPGGYICVDNMERPFMHEIYVLLREWDFIPTSQTNCVEAQEYGVWKTDFWKKPHDVKSLKQDFSWPVTMPEVTEVKPSRFSNEEDLKPFLDAELNIIVEIGSDSGRSTHCILDTVPHAEVIAITPDNDDFLSHCWQYQDRFIQLRQPVLKGLETIARYNVCPDLIYVNASHSFHDIYKDLEMMHRLFPGAQIVGDDWLHGKADRYPVQRTVSDFASRNNYKLVHSGDCWWIKKRRLLTY